MTTASQGKHEQRSEPRFAVGQRVSVARLRGAEWVEAACFTVNVSENGLLVTMDDDPPTGEIIRVHFPSEPGGWIEAVVRHVSRGTANNLVGLHLRQRRVHFEPEEEP